MADIYIALLSGVFFGMSLSLIIFPILTNRSIEKEQFAANLNLYRQMLLKKQNKKYEYSQSIRRVINSVHVALLVEHQNESHQQDIESSQIRMEPSI
ncbi:MAG: hypothetical protein V3U78_05560 [Thiotrichaceae bacterium]